MNNLLNEKIAGAYGTLYSIDSKHGLLKYIEGDGITFTPNLQAIDEFRKRFAPSIDVNQWNGKFSEGFVDYLVTITFRRYLSALEKAIREDR